MGTPGRKPIDLQGASKGWLSNLRDSGQKAPNGSKLWLADCKCGKTKLIAASDFKKTAFPSCGCRVNSEEYKKERNSKVRFGARVRTIENIERGRQ